MTVMKKSFCFSSQTISNANGELSLAASEWTNDVFSVVKSDRTGNHLTFGAKTGKPPFYFQDAEKV